MSTRLSSRTRSSSFGSAVHEAAQLRESLLQQQNFQHSDQAANRYGVAAKSRRLSVHTGAASPLVVRAHAASGRGQGQTSLLSVPPNGNILDGGVISPSAVSPRGSGADEQHANNFSLRPTPSPFNIGSNKVEPRISSISGDRLHPTGSPIAIQAHQGAASLLGQRSISKSEVRGAASPRKTTTSDALHLQLWAQLTALLGGGADADVTDKAILSAPDADARATLLPGVEPADEAALLPTSKTTAELGRSTAIAFSYGIINFVCVLPVIVAYAHIVYASNDFEEYMPYILKVVMLSCCIHQALFSWFSRLPFSIGQVQDVGLIFLAAITKNVQELATYQNALAEQARTALLAKAGNYPGLPGLEGGVGSARPAAQLAAQAYHPITTKEIVATSLWAGGIGTTITGLIVWYVGYRQLVDYVSLLPLPVVGGYLGYIGWFCIAAGLTIMSGQQINAPWTVAPLFCEEQVPYLVSFALFLVLFLFIHYRLSHHVFVMPTVLLLAPVGFLAIAIYGLGFTLEELREENWLSYPAKGLVWGPTQYAIYDPRLVHWSFLPRQIGNFIGLTIVVTFGSSLDVAAIQAEIPYRLDFNGEMRMIGGANFIAGLTGGMTGSYIFSQTIFSLKSQVTSSLCGWTVFFCEFLLWALPIDLSCVLPKPYVGALVALFGVDILRDWLWKSRALLSQMEYVLVWLAFSIIMVLQGLNSFGVIEGMLVATGLACVTFVCLYSTLPVWTVGPQTRSGQFRRYNERKVLDRQKQQIFVCQLKGYIFFGSSMDLSTRLLNAVLDHFQKADKISRLQFGGGGSVVQAGTGGGDKAIVTSSLIQNNRGGEGTNNPFPVAPSRQNPDQNLATHLLNEEKTGKVNIKNLPTPAAATTATRAGRPPQPSEAVFNVAADNPARISVQTSDFPDESRESTFAVPRISVDDPRYSAIDSVVTVDPYGTTRDSAAQMNHLPKNYSESNRSGSSAVLHDPAHLPLSQQQPPSSHYVSGTGGLTDDELIPVNRDDKQANANRSENGIFEDFSYTLQINTDGNISSRTTTNQNAIMLEQQNSPPDHQEEDQFLHKLNLRSPTSEASFVLPTPIGPGAPSQPKFVVLDFEQVQNIDSTACVSLASMKVSLKTSDVMVSNSRLHFVYCGIRSDSLRELLQANNALNSNEDYEFGALEDALNFIEEMILNHHYENLSLYEVEMNYTGSGILAGGSTTSNPPRSSLAAFHKSRNANFALTLEEILLEYFRQDPTVNPPNMWSPRVTASSTYRPQFYPASASAGYEPPKPVFTSDTGEGRDDTTATSAGAQLKSAKQNAASTTESEFVQSGQKTASFPDEPGVEVALTKATSSTSSSSSQPMSRQLLVLADNSELQHEPFSQDYTSSSTAQHQQQHPPLLGMKPQHQISLTDIRSHDFLTGLRQIAKSFTVTLTLPAGAVLFRSEDVCNAVFFVSKGVVEVSAWRSLKNNAASLIKNDPTLGVAGGAGPFGNIRAGPGGATASSQSHLQDRQTMPTVVQHQSTSARQETLKSTTISPTLSSWLRTRSIQCRPGALLGNTAFAYPKREMVYGFDAGASEDVGAVVFKIDREAMRRMELRNPNLALLLHKVFLQDMCYDAIRDLVD
ncbi:unnamed protein product [Amoebophrya sp. A120]|nr:unnamed protein product [Amoebophrya sp. A120]|eukprot:GSA120T00017279001.1